MMRSSRPPSMTDHLLSRPARPAARLLATRGVRLAAVAMAAAALAGCSTTVRLPPVSEASNPALGWTPQATPYRVQVGDDLEIRFLLNPELNEDVAVRPDGKISTTVAEDVQAAGRTIPQIDAELRQRYKSELMNPRLNVVVKSFAPTHIYVSGEVATPGEYTTVGPSLTLSQAIARAGGLRNSASASRVFLIRRGPGDRPIELATRYDDVITGRDPRADVRLSPYDVVYVPRSRVAQAGLYWNEFVQQFVPISWGFSYILNNPTGGTAVVPTTAVR